MKRKAEAPTTPQRLLGKTGKRVPIIGFPGVALARLGDSDQAKADELVKEAFNRGVTYFDVAPEYGDGVAQARLGPALEPFRSQCFLACKTMFRDAARAAQDLDTSLAALRTDHFDLYQLHSITSAQDVDQVLAPGGALEALQDAKKAGKIKHIGFSAHSEEQALRLIATGEFETVMFPINLFACHIGNVGSKVLKAAAEQGMGIIAIKALARCRLKPDDVGVEKLEVDEKTVKHIPKWKLDALESHPLYLHPNPDYVCWYQPEEDPATINKMLRWTLAAENGVVSVAIAPGAPSLLNKVLDCLEAAEIAVPGTDGLATAEFDMEKEGQPLLTKAAGQVPIFHDGPGGEMTST